MLLPAAASLGLFAWLLTLHPTAAGRIYAAYGDCILRLLCCGFDLLMVDILGANVRTADVMVCASLTYILSFLVASFYEPNYESGKAVRWEIGSEDGSPLGLAGIWEYKQDGPNGLPLLSSSMLTFNADDHPLMKRFHKPSDEKRKVVILHPAQYDDWLNCHTGDAPGFLEQYPADLLTVHAAPKSSRTSKQANLLSFTADGRLPAPKPPAIPFHIATLRPWCPSQGTTVQTSSQCSEGS